MKFIRVERVIDDYSLFPLSRVEEVNHYAMYDAVYITGERASFICVNNGGERDHFTNCIVEV